MPIVALNNRAHIALDGEDATQFLHNLVTTDILGLPLADLRSGALLSAQGKVLYSFLIARTSSGYMLDVALEDAGDFIKRLKFYRLRARVNIADFVPALISVAWGNDIPEADFVYDRRFAALDVRRCYGMLDSNASDTSWTCLRIDHGVAEAHRDYAYGEVFPHDINLDQTAGLSFSKGCYIGQEVVSRMHHRGTARRRLMVVEGDGLAVGLDITADGKSAGTLGSVCGTTALALVRLDRIKEALDLGAQITVSDQPVSLKFPIGVTYSWSEKQAGAL